MLLMTTYQQLGRSGLVSVEEDTAMQNHEAVETFYADYLDGRDSMVTVFEVHRDGLIEIDGLLLWQPELPLQDFLHSHALQFTSVLVYTTG